LADLTPLRKGMITMRVALRSSFGKWLQGLESVFRRKSRDANREISAKKLPAPRDEAEEALWQAMGWNEPQGGSGARDVVSRAAAEALRL
jgi:hypothetical protein